MTEEMNGGLAGSMGQKRKGRPRGWPVWQAKNLRRNGYYSYIYEKALDKWPNVSTTDAVGLDALSQKKAYSKEKGWMRNL